MAVTDHSRSAPQYSDAAVVREWIARVMHDAATGKICPDPTDPTPYGRMAEAVHAEVIAPLVTALVAAEGSRVGLAAELAGVGITEFMHLPSEDQRHWFGRVDGTVPEPVKLAHPMDADPFAGLDDEFEGFEWRDAEPVPLGDVLAPYEQRRQDHKADGWVA